LLGVNWETYQVVNYETDDAYIQTESSCELLGMETKIKGSDQPPTKVGLDDERTKTGEKKDEKRDDKGGITDKVMEDQAKHHEVQRT